MSGADDHALERPFLNSGRSSTASTSEADGVGPADLPAVRSYVLTKGRTRGRADLGYETLVSVQPDAKLLRPTPERQQIVRLAESPISAAEISAKLRIPIGAALILMSDLADENVVRLHTNTGPADVSLLQRLRNGIRAL